MAIAAPAQPRHKLLPTELGLTVGGGINLPLGGLYTLADRDRPELKVFVYLTHHAYFTLAT